MLEREVGDENELREGGRIERAKGKINDQILKKRASHVPSASSLSLSLSLSLLRHPTSLPHLEEGDRYFSLQGKGRISDGDQWFDNWL